MGGEARKWLPEAGTAAAVLRALCRAEAYWELVDESWLGETLKGQSLSQEAFTS